MHLAKKINSATLFALLILFISPGRLAAQQVDLYNHYFYKPLVYNPAFAGDAASAMLIHHAQWADFKGAPQFNLFMLDKNFMNEKIGLGLSLMSEKKGISKRTGGNLFYSYRLKINDDTRLLMGLSFGILDQALDFSKAVVENTSDIALFTDSQHKITYDGNVGMAFIFKGLELGLAAPHLFANKITYSDNNMHASLIQARHYMGSVKYKFAVSKEKGMSIAPQALIRLVSNAPFQYDGNINFDWKDKFWIGATYKSNYAVAANIGFCVLKKFSVGYSYDIITGSIGNSAGLSHEIMLNLKFGKNKKVEPETAHPEPVAKEPEIIKKDSVEPSVQKAPVEEKVKPAPETKPFDYTAYQKHKQDSLEKLKSSGSANGVWIGTYKVRDYKDASNETPNKGYYVIVGSFLNRDNAKSEVKRMINKGFKGTNWVYSETRKFNYVFIIKVNSEKEAVKHAASTLSNGAEFEEVWILRLID